MHEAPSPKTARLPHPAGPNEDGSRGGPRTGKGPNVQHYAPCLAWNGNVKFPESMTTFERNVTANHLFWEFIASRGVWGEDI